MKTYHRYYPFLILLLCLCALNIHAQPGRWAEPVNISNTPGGSSFPDMAIGANSYIHVVWKDCSRLGGVYYGDILYTVYNGYNWSTALQISSYDTTYSLNSKIAVD